MADSKKKKLQFPRDKAHPIIYQVFTRVIIGLTAVLLLDFLTRRAAMVTVKGIAFLIVAFLCAAGAWAAWLRLDGVKVMRFDRTLFRRKKRPDRFFGDMIDHVDEPVVSFDDLADEEKDSCLFVSNLICAAVFAILSCF